MTIRPRFVHRRPTRLGRSHVCLACLCLCLTAAATLPAGPSTASAAVNDTGPLDPTGFPASYGPAPEAFSPLQVPDAAQAAADSETEPLVWLTLNVAARRLYVYRGGTLESTYLTAVGQITHHTPIGDYSILSKAMFPTWYPTDGRPPVPPGPANPIGERWMSWRWDGYGLHGTNAEWSIGHWVSHGCVRMHNADVEKVFDIVTIGTPFRLVYEPVEFAAAPEWGGGFVLSLYPDIYNRVSDYQGLIVSRAEAAGVPAAAAALPPLDSLQEALATYGAVTFDTASPVYLGTRRLNTPVVRVGVEPVSQPLISLRAFAGATGLVVGWDEAKARATLDGTPVEAVVLGGRSYASPEALAEATGMSVDWSWEMPPLAVGSAYVSHRLLLRTGLVYVNGAIVSRQAFSDGDGTYVPLRVVAESFGLNVGWNAEVRAVTLGGTPVPAKIIDGTSYILTGDMARFLEGLAVVEVTPNGVFIFRP